MTSPIAGPKGAAGRAGRPDTQGSLYLVHRLVVASAVALAGLFSVYSGMRFEVTRDPVTLGLCLLAAGAAAALASYLSWFVRRHPRGR